MTSVLVAILLSIHLVCMNVASAGPLVCIWLDALASKQYVAAERAGQWLGWKSFQLALVGAILGLAIGWLRWDAEFAAVLQRFSSRITWGIAEFAFSLVLLGGYAAWFSRRPRTTWVGRWVRSVLAILSATNLLYHFPTLFTLIANASAGRIAAGTVDSAMFRKLIANSEVLALTTHFAVASIAITGVALIAFVWQQRGSEGECDRVAVWGGRIALAATLVQIPVGLWLFTAVPAHNQQRLMGGDLVGSTLFIVSIVAALSLLHQLAAVAFGNTTRRALLRTMQVMLIVVVAMTGVLQRLNQ